MLADETRGVNVRHRRDAHGAGARYVAAGWHAATAFCAARPDDVERVLVSREAAEEAIAEIAASGIVAEHVDRAQLERLAQGIPHQGVVAVGRPPRALALEDLVARAPDVVLVLDEVTDPRNVGALFRSAEASGAGAVVIARDRAPQLSPALVKAAAGAIEWLSLVRVVNIARTLEALQVAGYWTVGLAGEADLSLHSDGAIPGLPVALVVGSEGAGMRPLVRRACHRLVHIPMVGHTASLNVSVAAAVALFEVRRVAADRLVGRALGPVKP